MTDSEIIDFYWERSELAIKESSSKYGKYCFTIAYNILSNCEDSEECVSDTWLKAWNVMPPQRPNCLLAFFAKITRNLSFNKFKARMTGKRGGNKITVALDELEECVSAPENTESEYQRKEISESISRFLHTLSERNCNIFIRRYFYVQSIEEIAEHYHLSEKNVYVNLSRTRKKLRSYLKEEEYIV